MQKSKFHWFYWILLSLGILGGMSLKAQGLPVEGIEQQLTDLLRLDTQRALDNEKRALQARQPAPIAVTPVAPAQQVQQPSSRAPTRVQLLAVYGIGSERIALLHLYDQIYEMQVGQTQTTSKGTVALQKIQASCAFLKIGGNKRLQEYCVDRFGMGGGYVQ